MNLAFYSYFFGTEQNFRFATPSFHSSKYDCYFFTNNKTASDALSNTRWKVVFIDVQFKDDILESNMFGKHVKAKPRDYAELTKYDYLCYFDSTIQFIEQEFVEELVSEYCIKQNYAMFLKYHTSFHVRVMDEFIGSLYQHRYFLEKERCYNYIQEQRALGLRDTTHHHYITGFSIRNMKHEKSAEIDNAWYSHIQECGIQCQVAFFFAKQPYQQYIVGLSNEHFDKLSYNAEYRIPGYKPNRAPEVKTISNEPQKEVYDFCREFMRNNNLTRVLDVVCGRDYTPFAMIGGSEIYAIRIDQYAKGVSVSHIPVDVVVCSDVIEQIVDPNALIALFFSFNTQYYIVSSLCREVLCSHPKFNGQYSNSWFGPPMNPSHAREWTMDELKKYLGFYFEIVSSQYCVQQVEYQIHVLKKRM